MTRHALVSTFGATGLTMGLSLITSIVLARNLGPDGRGALLGLTFWPAMLVAMLGLSVNEATTYRVARANASEGISGARRYISSGLVIQMAIAATATGLTLTILPFLLPAARQASLGTVLWYAAAFTPLMTLDLHFKAVLQGRGAFHWLNVARLAQPVVYAAALLGLVLGQALSVESVIAAIVAALAVSVVVGVVGGGASVAGTSVDAMRETLATGCKFHLANVVLYAAGEADKLFVLYVMDDTKVGYYAVAIALSALGSGVVVQSLSLILTGEMAAMTTPAGQGDVLVRNMHTATLMLIVINGAAAVLAPIWLPILFGSQFAEAVPVVAILLLMGTIKGIRNILDRAMRATHNSMIGMAGEAVALAALVVLAPVGVKLAGLQGFAWGLCGAQACALVVMIMLAARQVVIDPRLLSPLHRDNVARLGRFARRELRLVREWWP